MEMIFSIKDIIWIILVFLAILVVLAILKPVFVLKRDNLGRLLDVISGGKILLWAIVITIVIVLAILAGKKVHEEFNGKSRIIM